MPVFVNDEQGTRKQVQSEIASDNLERSGTTIGANGNILSSVTGLYIRAGSRVRVTFQIRKSAAAVAPLIGFRINATVVCSTAAVGAIAFGAGALAQSGIVVIEFYVGEANYLQTGSIRAVLAQTAYGNPLLYTTRGLGLTADIPTATITSLAVTADAVGAVTVFTKNLKVYV